MDVVHEGDAVLLYCLEASGHVYCEPQNLTSFTSNSLLSIFPSKDTDPDLPNVHFGVFQIQSARRVSEDSRTLSQGFSVDTRVESNLQKTTKSDPLTMVYGGIIKLQHKGSKQYLCVKPISSGYLSGGASEACKFRIIPSNRDKGWGDDVNCNDNIRLESVLHSGYRIQCVYNPIDSRYNILLAVNGAVFTVKPYCHLAMSNDNDLKGGDVVMLFSLKIDGYLSAKKSLINDSLPKKFKQSKSEIGLRKWRVKRALLRVPDSGDTYIQLEKVTPAFSGGQLNYGDKCRIKHVISQQYFSVKSLDRKHEITLLNRNESNGDEIFVIVNPNNQSADGKLITVHSQIAFKHLNSQHMLGIDVRPKLHRQASTQHDPLSQWFNMAIYEIDDDTSLLPYAFRVDKVDVDGIHDAFSLVGISSVFISLLRQIPYLLPSGGNETKTKRLTSLVLNVNMQVKGMVVCLNKMSNAKRFINIFRTVQVVDAIIAIMDAIGVDDQFAELDSLQQTLTNVAVDTCTRICSLLEIYVEKGNFKSRHHLAKTALFECLVSNIGRRVGVESVLVALTKDDAEMSDLMESHVSSIVAQLNMENSEVAELLGTLAFSGRRTNIEIQKQIIEKTLQAKMIYNYHLNNYVTSALEAFVNKPVRLGVAAERMHRIYDYARLSSNPLNNVTIEFDDIDCIKVMDENVRQFLGANEKHVLYGDDDFKGCNAVTAQVLGVLVFLINYGVYSDGDNVPWLMDILIKIVDGQSDEGVMHYHGTGHRIILKVKTLALKSLHLLLKRNIYMSSQHILYDFKMMHGEVIKQNAEVEDEASDDYPPEMIQLRAIHCSVPSNDEDTIYPSYIPPPPDMVRLLDEYNNISSNISAVVWSRLRWFFQHDLYTVFDVNKSKLLSQILLDTIHYDDGDLQLLAAELLFDMYNIEHGILTQAEDSYLLTDATEEETARQMNMYATFADRDQLLRKMLKRQVVNVEELHRVLDMFSSCCLSEKDETEPNVYNQGLAYSSGLFTIALEYILEYGPSNFYDQEEILCSCFKLLQRIALKNPLAQNKLFEMFQDLLEVKIAVSSMTRVLNQIFHQNTILCKRLFEADIKQIFFTSIASTNPDHYELMVTLRTIIEATEPAAPLQESLAQLFVDVWDDHLGHILGSENIENRSRILCEDEDTPELTLLLNVCDLLSTCTHGECGFAESVSQSFFTLDELLNVICSENVATHRKLPFARILCWTYLTTERDSALACKATMESNCFWKHLEKIVNVINEELLKVVGPLPVGQKRTIQKLLRWLHKTHLSVGYWMKKSEVINSLLSDQMHNLNGILLYLMEGLLPLLTAFCTEMSLHISASNNFKIGIISHRNVTVLIEIGNAFANFYRLNLLTMPEQLSELEHCLESLKCLLDGLNNEEQFKFHETLSVLKYKSMNKLRTASMASLIEDDAEVFLNKELQGFIGNYRSAYEYFDRERDCYGEETLSIPHGPSFKKLVDLFSESDSKLCILKLDKLVILLRASIAKQKRQGIRSFERIDIERVTLVTLQVICSVIFIKISQLPPATDPQEFQKHYNNTVQPLQKYLSDHGTTEMLIGLLQHQRDDIIFQALACLNVMLFPGNSEIQQKITGFVEQKNQGLFLRVHEILAAAQSRLNLEKMGNAQTQISALRMQPVDDMETSLQYKLMTRSRSAFLNSTENITFDNEGVKFSNTRRSAIEEVDVMHYRSSGMISLPHTMSKARTFTFGTASSVQHVDPRITVALSVLSWMCDGQRKDMQDLMRQQENFSKSNIVSQVSFLLHGIAENLHDTNINIAQCAVQSLIEMCAGNFDNQELAFKGQVVLSIMEILASNLTSNEVQHPMLQLKSSSVELLEVMLEETDQKSERLAHWIFPHFNLSICFATMFELWTASNSITYQHIQTSRYRRSMFRAYHVLRRFSDYQNITVDELVGYHDRGSSSQSPTMFQSLLGENEHEARRMWQYCQSWSNSLEVLYKTKNGNNILTRAYFPYDPHKHLNEHEKDTVLEQIKRNTPEEKLSDLLRWTNGIKKYHNWKRKLKENVKTRWIVYGATLRHFALFWLTIVLNLLVLFSLEVPSSYNVEDEPANNSENNTLLYFRPLGQPEAPTWYNPVLYAVGGIYVILAAWMVIQFFGKNLVNLRFDIPAITKLMYKIKKGLIRRRYFYRAALALNKIFCCGKFRPRHPKSAIYFQVYFFGFEPMYRITFFLLSILGLALNGYFYCGCMIYLFLKNAVLKYILKALLKSATQLITVFIFGLVVMYIYGVISFVLIPNYFDPEDDLFCGTLFQCFISITRIGLLDTLGAGIPIRPSNSDYPPNFTIIGWRTLYDLLFFIVVSILGVNLVVAIMVDRFSDLRGDKDKIEDDNNTRCLICSISKDSFEQHGLDYQKHIKLEHNIWNYIHFALYLDTMHPNDHNALEKYVFERIPSHDNPGSIEFYPLRVAKVLPNYEF